MGADRLVIEAIDDVVDGGLVDVHVPLGVLDHDVAVLSHAAHRAGQEVGDREAVQPPDVPEPRVPDLRIVGRANGDGAAALAMRAWMPRIERPDGRREAASPRGGGSRLALRDGWPGSHRHEEIEGEAQGEERMRPEQPGKDRGHDFLPTGDHEVQRR